ncbi:Exopolysaccharide biosynthesis protein [Desulfoscipio geothermicus DSM 3669]|uniref:Exopolysaccharide biosynthesis protein n=1 Tax=Desulfoscipio geothermicus DSM 3669 TaxID=1121426 RepID=A0A1I6EJU6_9FIRM|nr:Exopolysaccharide biosynthesis protein [Desulfoscipio geothermicus DSM 3669]
MRPRAKILLITLFTILLFITSNIKFFSPSHFDSQNAINYRGKNVKITIRSIEGPAYKGKVMVVKSKAPGSIKIALSAGGLGTVETTSSMAKRTGAVAAVNGGGFYNTPVPGKHHNFPAYVTIHEGKVVHYDRPIQPLIAVGIDHNNRLVFGKKGPEDLLKRGVTEAVSFKPALIINGRPVIRSKNGEAGPRTAIGQTRKGDYIFVVIDGRQPAWSQGATIYQLMKIMKEMGAYNAFNLDGGGSSTMVFRGEVINKPSDITGERPVATAWVIYD